MARAAVLLGLIAALSTTGLGLLLLDRDDAAGAIGWFAALVGVLSLLIPLAVGRYDRPYFAWVRLRDRVTRTSSLPWTLSVEIRGDFSDASFFDEAEVAVEHVLPHRARVMLPRATNGRRFAIDGIGLLEVALDDLSELEATALRIDFTGLRVASYEAERRVEQELLPLIRAIESAGQGVLREQSWALRVAMDVKTNPYLPLYMRERDPSQVDVFRVSYKRPTTSGDRVDLSKESITLSAGSAEGFMALVRDFVAYSGRSATAPPANA